MMGQRGVVLMTICGLALLPNASAAQSASDGPSDVPRTADGRPDLQGVWDYRTLTPLERPEELGDKAQRSEEETADFVAETLARRNNDQRREGVADVSGAYNDFWLDYGAQASDQTSLIVDPANGRMPALAAGAIRSVSVERPGDYPGDIRPVRLRSGGISAEGPVGPEDRALAERCLLGFNSGPPMMPSVYNNNVQFFQTEDHVVILHEMVHDARIVTLGDGPRLQSDIRQWMGAPRGHWDGDTLVVESRNFSDKTASFNPDPGTALGSGLTLNLTERFTRVDADTLLYEFIVDDPETFTRPFSGVIPLSLNSSPIYEYACHEGNYGLLNMMRGARQQQLASRR